MLNAKERKEKATSLSIRGPRAKGTIDAVFRAQRSTFGRCSERSTTMKNLRLDLEIAANGRVVQASITGEGVDEALRSCVLEAVKKLSFEKRSDATTTLVRGYSLEGLFDDARK